MNLGHYGVTVKFREPASQAIFRDDITAPGFLPTHMGSGQKNGRYDLARFDFVSAIRHLLVAKGLAKQADVDSLESLSDLHKILPDELRNLDESELNAVSKNFYDTDDNFMAIYHRFVRDVLQPLFGTDLLFQATPTIRFHFPKQQGFAWKPRFHTDIMLGHPPQEVNVWLPCTRTFGTNSMTIAPFQESMELLRELDFDFDPLALKVQTEPDFAARLHAMCRPVELVPGDFLLFDSRCVHATQYNDTDATRISLDVRVVPVEDWKSMRMIYRGTGRRQMLFDRGHYYDQRLASEL